LKKENPKNFSLSVLLAGVLGCIALAFLLYFLITGVNKHSNGNDSRLDLNSQNISYLAEVGHMDSITEDEANTIKTGVQENITEKMDNLELEPNIDYTVNELDDIEAGVRLDSINVTVAAVKSSTKAKGELVVDLQGTENISDRGSDPLATISVPTADALSNIQAANLKLTISLNVNEILSQGQLTEEGVDYEIDGLNLIVVGATYADYNDKIIVNAISSSTKLTGSFTINFQLPNN